MDRGCLHTSRQNPLLGFLGFSGQFTFSPDTVRGATQRLGEMHTIEMVPHGLRRLTTILPSKADQQGRPAT